MNRRNFIRMSCGAALAAALPGKQAMSKVHSYQGCTRPLSAVAVGGSGSLYSSLPAAIEQEALYSGDEVLIMVLEDLHEAIVLPKTIHKKVSVDLGGHTLFTREDGVVCENQGTGDLSVSNGTIRHPGELKTVPISS